METHGREETPFMGAPPYAGDGAANGVECGLEAAIEAHTVAEAQHTAANKAYIAASRAENAARAARDETGAALSTLVAGLRGTVQGGKVMRVGKWALCLHGGDYWFVAPWPTDRP